MKRVYQLFPVAKIFLFFLLCTVFYQAITAKTPAPCFAWHFILFAFLFTLKSPRKGRFPTGPVVGKKNPKQLQRLNSCV